LYTLRQLKQVRKATGVLRPRNMLEVYQALTREWKLVSEIAREANKTTSQATQYLRILFTLGYAERKKVVIYTVSGGVNRCFVYRRNGRQLV